MNLEERKKGVNLVLRKKPNRATLQKLLPPGIVFASSEFLELFSAEIEEYLEIGRVYLNSGELLDSFCSVVGKRRLLIRGQEGSHIKNCEECGRCRYRTKYPWYISRSDLFGQSIYEAWPEVGLVVDEKLFARIDKVKWKGIYITKLPILDEPKDGINNFPVESEWADW